MAAHIAAIVILFISELKYSTQESLNQPFDLAVAKLSPENVLLGWKFTAPEGLSVDNVTFLIEYSGADGQPLRSQVPGNGSCRLQLNKLEKRKEYTARITALSAGLQSSEPATIAFTTLSEDYPTPQFVNNLLLSTRTVPEYELRWKVSAINLLSALEIKCCTLRCKTSIVDPAGTPDFIYSVKYDSGAFYTPYNVTITAIFAQPLGVQVRRSYVYRGLSDVGEPGAITNLHKTAQMGPVVRMKWKTPSTTNGPINYYRLLIDEIIDGTGGKELRTTVNEINATLPVPDSNHYRVRISAVNLDGSANPHEGQTTTFYIRYEPPRKPERIETLRLKPNSVFFKVIPAVDFPGIFHEIIAPSKDFIYTFPRIANFTGLKPYQTVHFAAHTCYYAKTEKRCGQALYASITSNVAGPDKVTDLMIQIPEDEAAHVNWNPPRVLNGPLDGYILSIVGPGGSDTVLSNSTLPKSTSVFALETDQCSDSCRIRVAAYNKDLLTEELVVGEGSEIHYRPYSRVPSIAAASILMLLVVVSTIGGTLYKRRFAPNGHAEESAGREAKSEEVTQI